MLTEVKQPFFSNAAINGSLEPTLLKPSLVFTFCLHLLTQRFTYHSHYFRKNKVEIHCLKYFLIFFQVKIHHCLRKIRCRSTSPLIILAEDSSPVLTYLYIGADSVGIHRHLTTADTTMKR